MCRFSAAVSLQEMRCLSDPAEKLPLRVAEGMTKSGGCRGVGAVCKLVINAFKRDNPILARWCTFETLAHACTHSQRTHALTTLRHPFSQP